LAFPAAIELLEDRALLAATMSGDVFFSLAQSAQDTSLPGLGDVNPDDIVRYDGSAFSFVFRGEDVGLGGADIDALSFLGDSELLMSFASTVNLPGLGSVGSSDVVQFVADQSGDFSAGTFSIYFDGSQVGLSSSSTDNVVAIDLLDNGNLLLSTAGEVVVTAEDGSTLPARREDILEFTPTSLSPQTTGSWTLYLDGSDVGLSFSTESIDGISVGPNGELFLSTAGSFFVDGFGGDNEDIVEFTPQQLGDDSSGSFGWPLFFNGNQVEPTLLFENINALEVTNVDNAMENVPPTAESESVSTQEDTSVSVQLAGDDGNSDVDQLLTFTILDGPSHGTIISFDATTGEAVYFPDADFHGTDSFTFVVIDDDTAGGEPLTSEAAVVSVEVTAVNDAPVNTVLETDFVGNEDLPILIQGISVHDVDAHEGTGLIEVTLSVGFGTLQVASADVADIAVDGNGSNRIVMTGTIESINSLLAEGIAYQGALNFSGTDSLWVVTSDLGNTGDGTVLSDSSEVGITVRSTQEQFDALDRVFEDLVESGELDRGPANSLQAKLKTGGNEKAQIGRLKAFTNQVKALVKAGKLVADQGEFLTDAASTIRDSLLIGRSKSR
jgi:hypothetical protein